MHFRLACRVIGRSRSGSRGGRWVGSCEVSRDAVWVSMAVVACEDREALYRCKIGVSVCEGQFSVEYVNLAYYLSQGLFAGYDGMPVMLYLRRVLGCLFSSSCLVCQGRIIRFQVYA